MKYIRPTLKVWEKREDLLVGFQMIKCHLIFDIKLGENFRRKARYVVNSDAIEKLVSLTHSSVVCRDSIRAAFLLAV